MWIGACTSTIGTFVQQFAQSWLVFFLTNDPFYLGLDLFLGQLPIILFSLVGGVFADRLDRRKLLLMSQYIQMACAFVLAILYATQGTHIHVWYILTLSFIVGLGQAFGGPAYSALLPTLVDAKDLTNAVAMNSIQFNLARIIGPTIGGLAYIKFGPTWCFVLNGLSYLAPIISLYAINVKFVPPKSSLSILHSMKEGISFIRRREGMTSLVVLAFATTLLGFPLTAFLPVFVKNVFGRGPETLAVLMACSGAGSVFGGLIVAATGKIQHQGRAALLILTAMGAIITGFALSHWLPLSMALLFAGGTAIMACASLMLTLVQLVVSDDMRGRVMSVYNLAFRGGMPLGSLVLGRLMPILGVSLTMAFAGSLLILLSLYFLLVQRQVATLQMPMAEASGQGI
jgi:predicted MFS family arabinose efflux permease